MTGEIPNSLGKLIVLAELKLEGEENMFTGKVPDAICDLKDDSGVLEVLTAHCNDSFSCECCTQCFWIVNKNLSNYVTETIERF